MDIQEMIQQANAGNIDAMLALGDYYSDNATPHHDYDEAIKWYELAAKQGNLRGTYCSMLYRKADAWTSQMAGNLEAAYVSFSMSYQWARVILQSEIASTMNDDMFNNCIDCYFGGMYGIAESAYFDAQKYENALEFANLASSDSSPIRSKALILSGLCLIKIGRKTQGKEGLTLYNEAAHNFLEGFSNSEYLASPKTELEEIAFVDGLIFISNFYLDGIPGYFDKNPSAAENLILSTISYVETKELRQQLQDLLNRM